jgi:hypothetical protein
VQEAIPSCILSELLARIVIFLRKCEFRHVLIPNFKILQGSAAMSVYLMPECLIFRRKKGNDRQEMRLTWKMLEDAGKWIFAHASVRSVESAFLQRRQ